MKRFVVSKGCDDIEDFSSRESAVEMAKKLVAEFGKKKARVMVHDRATGLILWRNESYVEPECYDVGGWGGQ